MRQSILFPLLISISINELNHEFTFRIAFAVRQHQREASPLGGGAGHVDATKKTNQANSIPNDRHLAMQGGILTALPTDAIGRMPMGENDPQSLYLPNKIHASCDLCGAAIPRYDGYRHALIGVKRVVCSSCQSSLGLPLRDADTYASYRD
jgi:hypothetical protein